MNKFVVLAASALVSGAVFAEQPQKLTLDVDGVYCGGCSAKIGAALTEGGVKLEKKKETVGAAKEGNTLVIYYTLKGPLVPNKEKKGDTVRILAPTDKDIDLAAAAAKVQNAMTPHKAVCPPGLSVVLYGDLDEESAKKAKDALAKITGVDAKKSKVNIKEGEIVVRVTGKGSITTATLLDQLKAAQVAASTEKPKTEKEETEKKELKP